MSKYWSGAKLLVQTIVSRYLDTSTNLLSSPSAFWFTAQGYQSATAPTALFAVAIKQLADVATSLGDTATATQYNTFYQTLSVAINTHLWTPSIGEYSLALSNPSDTSLLATAFTIRAGICNNTQATTIIRSLSSMFYQIGYKDSTAVRNGPTTQLSPNVPGFLLESLFIAKTQLNVSANIVTPTISNLLATFWTHMVTQNQYSTGASWEYAYPDGSPGLGMFTSLSHPWGGAPACVLTEYILGIRRQLDTKTGQYGWIFDPILDVAAGLNVSWANGTVPLLGIGNGAVSGSAVVRYVGNAAVAGGVEVVDILPKTVQVV